MLDIGHMLDKKYEVIRMLGRGGMGKVYLCKNTRLGNFWAIKEVLQDTENIDVLTEAIILKNLKHPGIRRIVDIFFENKKLYMVQDYVEGQTLKEYVKVNGRLKAEKICQITSDLCDIIGYLHSLNPAIIYRDIKPSNIMITPDGKVILIDFGISKVYEADISHDTVCTGSNGYAAPEQYGLGKCCTQTDIYGIGMIIYFMIKGKAPFTGVEPLFDENYDSNNDENFKKIIQQCVKIDIKDRYSSVEALKDDILKVIKKEKCEKTVILNEARLSTNRVKKTKYNKSKVKKNTKGILCFIVVILASVHISYGNKKESKDINISERPEIMSPIVELPRVEQDAFKETIIVPMEEASMGIIPDSTINEKK